MNDPIALIRSLEGKRPWRVQLGIGSFLVFDFGKPIQLTEEHTCGEWGLWIRCSAWRLRTKDQLLIGSEETREKLEAEIIKLENYLIVRSELNRDTLDIQLEFDTGLLLETFSFVVTEYEHWSLNYPEGMVLIAGPGLQLHYGRADLPRDQLKCYQPN